MQKKNLDELFRDKLSDFKQTPDNKVWRAIDASLNKKKKRRVKRKAKKAKRDACYHKVKARYDVWPSAYASGALVKCRKVGAANWGEGGKKK